MLKVKDDKDVVDVNLRMINNDHNIWYKVEKMLKKMPGLDKSKEDSRSITTIQVSPSQNLNCYWNIVRCESSLIYDTIKMWTKIENYNNAIQGRGGKEKTPNSNGAQVFCPMVASNNKQYNCNIKWHCSDTLFRDPCTTPRYGTLCWHGNIISPILSSQ